MLSRGRGHDDPGVHAGPLQYVIDQVWGQGVASGRIRAVARAEVPAGWEVREEYQVIPTASSPQLLVPRTRRAAVRSLADYAGLRSPRTRLIRRGLAAVAAARVPLSTTRLNVIAPIGAPLTTVAAVGLTVDEPDAVAAIGVRTGANAKPTLELRTPSGDPIGFVKLAWNAATDEALANEAQMIGDAQAAGTGAIRIPKVRESGFVDGRRFVMTEALPRSIRDVPARWDSLRRDEEWGPGTIVGRAPLSSLAQVRTTIAHAATMSDVTPPSLSEPLRAAASAVADADLIVTVADFSHGDFVPWNVGRDAGGNLWLFDWETAQRDAPAGLDTLHWFANTTGPRRDDSLAGRVAAAADRSEPVLRSLGHTPEGASAVSAWYAIALVLGEVRLAEAGQGWARSRHSPAALEALLVWAQERLTSSILERSRS